jgi:Uma2 family endonuclease
MIGLLGAAGATRGLLAVGDVKLGEPDDYRVPDAALTPPAGELFNPTAPLVVEILSTGDATQQKLPFDARHGVSEVVIVDPDGRTVRWLALAGRRYEMVERSRLLDLDRAGGSSSASLGPRNRWDVASGGGIRVTS